MLEDNYVTFEIGKAKHIALVAHDGKKKELVDWCDKNKDVLKSHFLCGTGTTARLIAERTGQMCIRDRSGRDDSICGMILSNTTFPVSS